MTGELHKDIFSEELLLYILNNSKEFGISDIQIKHLIKKYKFS